jgi:hypothetical protein
MDLFLFNFILITGIIGGTMLLFLTLYYFNQNKTQPPTKYKMMQKLAGNN